MHSKLIKVRTSSNASHSAGSVCSPIPPSWTGQEKFFGTGKSHTPPS